MARLVEPAIPLGFKVGLPIGEPLTNIDATDLAHPENQARIRDAQRGNLPVGQRLDQGPLPDPLWISRTQSSPSPPDERPWVRGYRWWIGGVQYETYFDRNPDSYRIDFLWKDHRHAYVRIPRDVWEYFRSYIGHGGSPGVWFHENILVENWKPGRGARYAGFAL